MTNNYAFREMKENMARALFKDLDISMKVSVEMANFIRGRTTGEAKAILNRVLVKKQAIPFKRFTDGVGHRAGAGIGPGRFPQKASTQFIAIIDAAEANAQAKGLSSNLKIVHLAAQKGTNQFHPGRQRRRMFKRTHLEIVVEEQEKVTKETSKKKAPKKAATKDVKEQPKKTKEPTAVKSAEKITKEEVVEKKKAPEKKAEPKKESQSNETKSDEDKK